VKQDNRRLFGGAALAVVLAAAGGFGLAKCTSKPVAPAAEAAKTPEAKSEAGLAMTAEAIQAAGVIVQPVTAGGLALWSPRRAGRQC
jgi:cobalt-zinc-cadmium efflux system membrane fusion protein